MFGFIRMPGFIRRFIRRRTKEVPVDKAINQREKLSLVYAFVAWNVCGFIGYKLYTGQWTKIEKEKDLSQGRSFVKMLQLENVTLHRMKGVNYIEQVDLNEEMSPKTNVMDENKEPEQEES